MPLLAMASPRVAVRVENNAGLTVVSAPATGGAGILKEYETLNGGDRNVEVEIFDLAGHLLRTESVPSVQAVSLEGLPAGVYVVRVKSEGRPVSVYKCVNR